MNMTRVGLCCAILLSWAFAGPATAQDYYDPQPGFATTSVEPNTWYVPLDPLGIIYRGQTNIGNGPGWNTGYQTFAAFAPIQLEPGRSLFWVDGRGSIQFDGNLLANVGTGFRYYSPEVDRVFGAGFWFDHDERKLRNYDQFGISAESLGTYFDFRVNAYLPITRSVQTLSSTFTGTSFFLNRSIGLGHVSVTEAALGGGDFEVGGALPGLGNYGIRSYIGGYYLQGPNAESTVGVKTRTEALITEDLTVGVSVFNDRLFGTNVLGQITLQIPDGRPNRILSRQPTQERLYAQMQRNNRVSVYRNKDTSPVLAINPATGLPYSVVHVNNIGGGGTGGVNDPLSSLPTMTAAGVDYIIVNRGDGTSRNMDQGITLRDNQHLIGLGGGLAYTLVATQGTFALPGSGTTGLFPTITNLTGDAVTLADNNEVAGLNIKDALGSGVFGNGSNNFNLHHLNVFQSDITNLSPTSAGITLVNATGTGRITNSQFAVNALHGISISNSSVPPLDVTIDNNVIQNSGIGIGITADDSNITAAITNNTIDQSTTGIALNTLNNGRIDASIHDNAVAGSTGDGMQTQINSGIFNLSLFDNSFMANLGNGLNLGGSNGAQMTVNADNNTLLGNQLNGLLIAPADSTLTATFTNNGARGNAGSGILIQPTGNSTTNLTLATNSFSGNLGAGFELQASGGTQNLTIGGANATDGNTFNGNLLGGILFDLSGTAVTTANIENNQIVGAAAGGSRVGFSFTATGGATVNPAVPARTNTLNTFDIVNTSANTASANSNIVDFVFGVGSAAPGFNFFNNGAGANPPGAFTVLGATDVSTGFTSLNGTTAPAFAFGTGSTVLNMTFNDFNPGENFNFTAGVGPAANNRPGVNAAALAGSTVLADFSGGQVLTGTLQLDPNNSTQAIFVSNANAVVADGIVIKTDGSAILQQTSIVNNQISGNSGTGLVIDSRGQSSIQNLLVQGNDLSSNGLGLGTQPSLGSGIDVQTHDQSQMNNLAITSNDLTGNGLDGIHFMRFDDSVVNGVAITTNLLNDNGDDGIDLVAAGGALDTIDFSINGNDISNNGHRGIGLQVNADGQLLANINGNNIDGNFFSGIQVTEIANDPTDLRTVSGLWTQNQITNNGIQITREGSTFLSPGGHGIQLFGNVAGLVIGQVGTDADGFSLGNVISGNSLWGIEAISAGQFDINNNLITQNGTAPTTAVPVPANGTGGGVAIEFGSIVNLVNNTITDNRGDGLKLRAGGQNFLGNTANGNGEDPILIDAASPVSGVIQQSTTNLFVSSSGSFLQTKLLGNEITLNDGRGVNLINAVNSTTFLTIGDDTVAGSNNISFNKLEGIYLVSTASRDQQQNVPATDTLLANGGIFSQPDLVFDMRNNRVIGNGANSNFSGAGLVLRVGSSTSAGFDISGDGLFGVGDPSLVGNGRVNARVVNNVFSGNAGSDVYIDSFRSTIDPVTTTTTLAWPIPTVLQRDPLARLNLVFFGNTGDSIDVTNSQLDFDGNGDGAFYNNAEGVFKSRLVGANPGGPFLSASRRRNATRLADFIQVPGSPPFAFDGVGDSTFRVESNFDVSGFTLVDGFFSAAPLGFTPDEIQYPYIWDPTVAPGTFQFLP
jgi:hypothetical protein